MHTPSIQNEHNLTSYHAHHIPDKGDPILRMDILLIHPKINAQPLASRRQGNGGLNRHAVVAAPHLVSRRVPRQSPCPPTGGLQQEAALIDPDEGHPLVSGFFLIRGHSTKRHWPMASSSRSRAWCWGYWHEKPNPCSRRPTWTPQTCGQSPARLADTSTARYQSPPPGDPPAAVASTAPYLGHSTDSPAPDAVWL